MAATTLIVLLVPLTVFAANSCYYPNGTDANAGLATPRYIACNANARNSMCCSFGDTCRSDGLCTSGWDGNTWRDFCTDKTWQAPACQKLCVNGTGLLYANNPANRADTSVTITQCPDGSYCCGHGQPGVTCCQQGNGVFMVNGEAQKRNPNAATSSSSASATRARKTGNSGSPTPIAATNTRGAVTLTASAAPQSSDKSSNTGAIVGGVIGGIAGLAIITGLAFFLWRRRRNGRPRRTGMKYSEMDGTGRPAEKPATIPMDYYDRERKDCDGGNTMLDGLPRAEMPMESGQDIHQDRKSMPRQELSS